MAYSILEPSSPSEQALLPESDGNAWGRPHFDVGLKNLLVLRNGCIGSVGIIGGCKGKVLGIGKRSAVIWVSPFLFLSKEGNKLVLFL